MSSVGSYLMTSQFQPSPSPTPADGAGPVLDAIEAAGRDGADIQALVSRTGYDEKFVQEVLNDLQHNGMTSTVDTRYRLTGLGTKARYIVAR